MRLVAESTETVRVPVSAVLAGAFVDPSSAGARGITVALKPQGTYPAGGDFTITGLWEQLLTSTPPGYWVTFAAPGNLVRGKNYQVYIKLAAVSGETPILTTSAMIEAV